MNDSQCLEAIRLFLAAVWQMRQDGDSRHTDSPVPYDARAFARVIDREVNDKNEFAARFWVLGPESSRHCPDFGRSLDLAKSAGYVHLCQGGFMVDLMRRHVNACQREPHYELAIRVATAYLAETER